MEDPIIPNQGVQKLDRYAYVNNSPVFFIDPSGNKACDQIDENGNCEVNLDWQSSKTPKPVDPLGEHLKDEDLQVLAVLMYYEYNGFYEMTADIWKIVRMKFWIFMNLINSRKWWITHQAGIYNGSRVRIGEWNPYVAVAGQSPLKPVLNYRLKGWNLITRRPISGLVRRSSEITRRKRSITG